jgi:hypothetical protein
MTVLLSQVHLYTDKHAHMMLSRVHDQYADHNRVGYVVLL